MAKYIQLQKNDIQKIARNYNLAVADFEPIEGGAGNSRYWLRTRLGYDVLAV